MRGINLAICAGNLGGDPEVRDTGRGDRIASFKLAMSRKQKREEGNKNVVQWVRVVTHGDLADICARNLSKGDSVFVQGEFVSKDGETDPGTGRKTTIVEVHASVVNFLKLKKRGDRGEPTELTAT